MPGTDAARRAAADSGIGTVLPARRHYAEGMATLVIVESPAKARKIAGYLGRDYVVRASLGHVRDLPGSKGEIPERYRAEPWAALGVNPQTFTPIYVVPASKQAAVKELRQLAARADRVLFASDLDREGEAAADHCGEWRRMWGNQKAPLF